MIRFAMCGCGGFIERAVLPMMKKAGNAKPVAAFGGNERQVQKVCDLFEIKNICRSYEELLAVPGVDAVYIASPNVFHKPQAIAAAEAGKHVFCQKPLGMNGAECKAMLAACKRNKVRLGVGFCYRFGGAQQKVRQMIKSGAIGEVSYVYLSFHLFGYNPKTAGWRCDPKKSGGGPLMDLAPHLVDLAGFFLDDQAESVMAYVKPPMSSKRTERDVLAIMQFKKGAKASMDISFSTRGTLHNYTVVGSKGELHAIGTMPWLTGNKKTGHLIQEKKYVPLQEVGFSTHEHIQQEIRCFCEAVEKGKEVPVPGATGLHAQAVIDAIYESGRTGRRCTVL